MRRENDAIQDIIIIGLGETAEMAYDYFVIDSSCVVRAFAAEARYISKHPEKKEVCGLPIVSVEEIESVYPPNKYKAFVAMSYSKLNHDRARLFDFVKERGYSFVSYISSRAFIGTHVEIGENCFILENNVLQRNVKIGNDVFLWSGNHIGHRSIIEDHVFLSSHVAVSGFCRIGEYSFLGINSSLGDNVSIAPKCFIGGGVTIMHDTKEAEIYKVNPAVPERLNSRIVFGYTEE